MSIKIEIKGTLVDYYFEMLCRKTYMTFAKCIYYLYERVEKALSYITQFNSPNGTPPEKYLHQLLLELDCDDEITHCAKKYLIRKILTIGFIKDMDFDKSITLCKIVEIVSTHIEFENYVSSIKAWLTMKKSELNLNI